MHHHAKVGLAQILQRVQSTHFGQQIYPGENTRIAELIKPTLPNEWH